jgi:hypothetical protein
MSEPNKKLVRAFYRGAEQRLKVFDGTTENQILESIKKVFHIKSETERIFLQDEDGDILVFPSTIPNGLCVHIHVEPEFEPKETEQMHSPPNQDLLPGFKWNEPFLKSNERSAVSSDGYTLGNNECASTSAVSTTEYKSGRLFFKMNVNVGHYQYIGVVKSDYDGKEIIYESCYNASVVASHYFLKDLIGRTISFAVYVDFDQRFIEFFYLSDDKVRKRSKQPIPSGPLKIYAYAKYFGFRLLEGGSSPIPPYILKTLDDTY